MPGTAPSTQDWQDQLLKEVGDPNGTVTALLGAIWNLYAERTNVDSRLPYLYTKRAALDLRLAEEQPDVDLTVGSGYQAARSQEFAHLLQMRDTVQSEVVRVESIAGATRVPQYGDLSKVTPEVPPESYMPDATDPMYRGDPYVDQTVPDEVIY